MKTGTKIGVIAFLSLGALSCDNAVEPTVAVAVSRLPAEASYLLASVNLNGADGKRLSRFDLGALAGKTEVSFGLRLPLQASGKVILGVGVFARADCLLAAGGGEVQVNAADTEMKVAVDALPQPDCTRKLPVLVSATPSAASTAGGTQVTIRGWGFQQGATVSILGKPARNVSWRSAVELAAEVPAAVGTNPASKVALKVTNPDGSASSRDDLLSYFYGTVRLLSTSYKVGAARPRHLAVGDLNGDAWPDVAVVGAVANKVSILLNRKDGTFPTLIPSYTTGTNPTSVALADVNKDDRPDVIVANTDNDTVGLFVNKGDGTFPTMGTVYQVGVGPSSVAAADLNGDGLPDIVVANSISNTVSVLLNQGGGVFPLDGGASYPVGRGPLFLVLADVNDDNQPDVIVADATANGVSVLLNQGDGTFPSQRRVDYPTGKQPYALAVGDLNGDGRPDLAVVNHDASTVTVLLNQGQGRFMTPGAAYPTDGLPVAVVISDINRDGRPDLVVASTLDNTASVLLNQGGGTFPTGPMSPAGGVSAYSFDSTPEALVLGDIDKNGILDLVSANWGNSNKSTVNVLLNKSE